MLGTCPGRAGVYPGLRPRRRRLRGLHLRLDELRLLAADPRLEARDDLGHLVAVLGAPFEVALVIVDGVLEVADVDVRAGDVEEDVRVRKDVVGGLQLLDAGLVVALADGDHALLEVGPRLGSLVGPCALRNEEGRR